MIVFSESVIVQTGIILLRCIKGCSANHEANERLYQRGIFGSPEFNQILFGYLSMGIDEILRSENPLIRGLGMLDNRCGKRRLAAFNDSEEHPLVKTFVRFRCQAEEIEINS